MIVAIDGPAGVGKSTVSSRIAEENNFFNLNSGNFYRAITYYILENGIDQTNEIKVIDAAQKCKVTG